MPSSLVETTEHVLKQVWEAHIKEIQLIKAHYQWMTKYPGYCQECGASGVINWTENGAPHGEGYWPMPVSELCSRCTGHGHCPRCGYDMSYPDIDAEKPCFNCQWNWGKDKDDYCPPAGAGEESWYDLEQKVKAIILPIQKVES